MKSPPLRSGAGLLSRILDPLQLPSHGGLGVGGGEGLGIHGCLRKLIHCEGQNVVNLQMSILRQFDFGNKVKDLELL